MTMNSLTIALLWFGAIGCGVIAGVYFAFSAFIMTAFSQLTPANGIAVMSAINDTILRSLFMPLFFGTTLVAAVLFGVGTYGWSEAGSAAMVIGGGSHFIGMFVVTLIFNVPLNNELVRLGAAESAPSPVWTRYLTNWTMWNHVRTTASVVGAVSFNAALISYQG